jgi:hypothetical protein
VCVFSGCWESVGGVTHVARSLEACVLWWHSGACLPKKGAMSTVEKRGSFLQRRWSPDRCLRMIKCNGMWWRKCPMPNHLVQRSGCREIVAWGGPAPHEKPPHPNSPSPVCGFRPSNAWPSSNFLEKERIQLETCGLFLGGPVISGLLCCIWCLAC